MATDIPHLPADWARSVLAGPVATPPYSGAIEDEFAWHLVKYLPETARLCSEVETEVPTASGLSLFTSDFVVEVPAGDCPPARRVAFEIGDARTIEEAGIQIRRDATLLASGAVDAVYRLSGSDLMASMEDALYLASVWDPALFSERGRINLHTLASPEARTEAASMRPGQPGVYVYGGGDETEQALFEIANGRLPHLHIRRLDARFTDVWRAYAAPLATSATD